MNRQSGSSRQNVILHDAYFNKAPSLARLFLFRLALLCAFSASAAAAICSLYHFNEYTLFICAAAAAMTGVMYTLMSVFPAWAAGTGIILIGVGALIIKKDEAEKYLGFFWDRLMLKLESRLLKTSPYLIHSREKLEAGVYDVEASVGCVLFAVIAAFLFSFIVVCSCRARPRPLPAVIFTGLLCAPAFAAEFAGFHLEMIPFAALLTAICVIDDGFFLDGMLVFGKARLVRESEYRNEKGYRRRTRFFILGRKLRSDLTRYVKYNANAIVAIIVSAAVMLSAQRLIPEGAALDYRILAENIGMLSARVGENIGDFFGTGVKRINDNGYFSHSSYAQDAQGIGIGSPATGSEPVLEVLLDSNETPVYLRGDIGVDFTGSGWTVIKGEYRRFADENGTPYAEIFKDFYPETQYRVLRQRLSTFGYDPDLLFPLRRVSVTYLKSSRVVFVPLAPYDLNYKSSDYFDSFGDCVLRTGYGSGYLKTYESLALVPDMNSSEMRQAVTSAQHGADYDWTLPEGLSLSEYNEKMAQYESFVNAAYLGTNETGARLHEILVDEGYISEGMDDFELADGVCRYFKENFSYSLEADNGGDDEAVENFLFVTRQGHCALFATAMTLVMRDMGFPARYVTGYVVSGEGEARDNGDYLYTLYEKNLHAWVEVYFDNVGWLPFDPTAGTTGFDSVLVLPEDSDAPVTDASDVSETSDTEQAPDESHEYEQTTSVTSSGAQSGTEISTSAADFDASTTAPPETESEALQPPQAETKKDFSEIFAALLPFITAAAITAAIALTLVLFVLSVKRAEKKAFSGFRKKAPHKAVGEMYELVLSVLSRCGAAPENELPDDFARRVDEEQLKGTNLFMTDVMPIFVKCEFGRQELSPVTEEERRAVFVFCSALYRLYMKRINPVFGFFAKISLFL